MNSIVWLALTGVFVVVVVLTGRTPRGGKPVARTRLMHSARTVLLGGIVGDGWSPEGESQRRRSLGTPGEAASQVSKRAKTPTTSTGWPSIGISRAHCKIGRRAAGCA
jgi:hypothetical protein